MKILVLGATGYVGGRLVPRLKAAGHEVVCLVRNPNKAKGRHWAEGTEIVPGNILDPDSLDRAMKGVEVVYHLVHSMGAGEGAFAELDRRGAANVASVATANQVSRIIYLGGLGSKQELTSEHLRSRHEVGDILRGSQAAVTEFRAAVIIGSGSLSFELIHHLVNRLPVMICPSWVYTRTQPIGIGDVLRYLVEAPTIPESAGRLVDIGGLQVLSYGDLMLLVARTLGLKRHLIRVPVLTPRLSSYWVNLVTPIQADVARALIEGLRYETVCENDLAQSLFGFETTPIDEAVERALARYQQHSVETSWIDAGRSVTEPVPVDDSHLQTDRRVRHAAASVDKAFSVISSIGGENGWYFADWLWRLRGFIDKQVGGVGLRRGRRHPSELAPGDALDFWRVEEVVPPRLLVMKAEMKLWGQAWLRLEVNPAAEGGTQIEQTAIFYPRGLPGLIYWYAVWPLHAFVFRGLIRSIAKRAERSG